MATEIKVPASGESITSANVAKWHKRSGDHVKKGEVLVTLETDKVSNELEAESDGVLTVRVGEGEEVGIGTVIGMLESVAGGISEAVVPAVAAVSSATEVVVIGEAVDLKVPAAGESITSANVASWRKRDGDRVEKGELLVSLETDKVANDLEAPVGGTLQILVGEGEEVEIGRVIGKIVPGGAVAAVAKKPVIAVPAEVVSEKTVVVESRPKPKIEVVTEALVKSEKPAVVQEGRTTRRKMSMLRRKIATHLVNAQQTAAILTTFNEVDMTAVMDLRKGVQEDFVKKHGVKLGFMSFFVKAVTQALKDVPAINGRIDSTDVIENHFYDIGVAIGTEKGLIVPVLRDCDLKSFADVEREILEYAEKGRTGKISIEDLQGGVFTISNGGVYGSLLSTPILNPPQSGILGMHTIQQRPVALNGQVVIRPMMYLALSYDHRLVDGKEAVTFLIRIKDCLENPHRLLLEM
jgi:2-oxoglutarate dehydrogenase E2 component (dihydrolipoamide succinyltransferase)